MLEILGIIGFYVLFILIGGIILWLISAWIDSSTRGTNKDIEKWEKRNKWKRKKKSKRQNAGRKKKIEFEKKEYDELFDYVKDKPIEIFASVWDEPSVDFMSNYTDIMKIGSASITDKSLCKYARSKSKFLIISGKPINEEIARGGPFVMNTKAEILQAVQDYHNGTFVK